MPHMFHIANLPEVRSKYNSEHRLAKKKKKSTEE